jgi:aryl-alcohol dehydrogenase-like predicted oxidoreductase
MAISYRHLGRTGLKVSPLCLGTMNFGPQTSEPDSYAIMDRALELGINFFDTADVYGWKRGEGVTEQIVGRWWAQGGNRRERTVIATKVYGDMDPPSQPDVNMARGLSAAKIVRACENSLKRMQTDYIDLYQMHHIDRTCPFDEVWQAMETLVWQGKVRYVGSSNFAGWDIAKANETAKQRGFLGLVSEQSLYNLNARMIELEVVPACRSRAGCSAARSRSETKAGGRAKTSRRTSRRTARNSRRGKDCAASSARRRRTSLWRGSSRTPS